MSNLTASDALAGLYREHHGWLLGWLRRRLDGAHNADDLAQDTFVRLLTSADEVAPREPRPYLITIAKRLVIDHGRRTSLERAYLDALAQLPEPVAPSPEQRLLVLETLQRIDAVLDGLPARARTAFLLAQLEGLTYAEIGTRLGVTERSVKRYVAQAFEHCILLL